MEKLCEFEESVVHATPTIDLQKYESWWNGSHLADTPDVGTGSESDDEHPSADASPMSTLEPQSLLRASSGAKKVQAAVRKLKVMRSLSTTDHKDQINLDFPSEVDLGLEARLERVRSILIRQAAHDQELGYCQGMHVVATVFVAASDSQGEAYWRFHAFISSLRDFWLPEFSLLETAAAQFRALASTRPWYEHMCAHAVEVVMYLPQAWLGLFSSWLPLPSLVECIQLLEGSGLSGILSLTLAILDHLGATLMKETRKTDILRMLANCKDKAPSAAILLQETRKLMTQVSMALLEPRQDAIRLHLSRVTSRVVDADGEVLAVPSLSELVLEAEIVSSDDLRPPPRETTCTCWSGFFGRRPPEAHQPPLKPQMLHRRASFKLHEQRAELESFRKTNLQADCPQSHWDARAHATQRRSRLSWAQGEVL